MLDDEFEDRLKEAARAYNAPPETPREAMWAAIVAARAGGRRTASPPYRIRIAAGIAAILVLGFGLGRLTRSEPATVWSPVAAVASPRVNETAYRIATTEHLGQSEAFLTLFRASVERGSGERLGSATARQLLATNRLLLDSPASNNPRLRLLLQDLELVLAEIAQLSEEPRTGDVDLIREGLDQGGVLTRLRTAVPPGASPTQGAL